MVQRQTQQPGRSGNKQSHLNAAQVEKYIAGIDFPCDKEGLIDCAKKNKAPDEVLEVMQQFSQKEFNSPMEVAQQFSQTRH